jgi:hypothetical protein
MMPSKKTPAAPCKTTGKRIERTARELPAKPCPVRNRVRQIKPAIKIRGNAILEVTASLLVLVPLVVGIPLLGKQFDVNHKTLDAARYAIWERTVRTYDSPDQDIQALDLAIRDRILGDATAGLLPAKILRTTGVSQNPLWRDSTHALLIDRDSSRANTLQQWSCLPTPIDVGEVLVPTISHGDSVAPRVANDLGIRGLQLPDRTFARASIAIGLRKLFRGRPNDSQQSDDGKAADPLVQRASAAILSDTWSAIDETTFAHRVDRLVADEFVDTLEQPGRPIAMQAPAKGRPLYGEGQFAFPIDLRPVSSVLPSAYVKQQ